MPLKFRISLRKLGKGVRIRHDDINEGISSCLKASIHAPGDGVYLVTVGHGLPGPFSQAL
jgi:hypothetical protein